MMIGTMVLYRLSESDIANNGEERFNATQGAQLPALIVSEPAENDPSSSCNLRVSPNVGTHEFFVESVEAGSGEGEWSPIP